MATMLERQMRPKITPVVQGTPETPTELESFSAAPTEFSFDITGKSIVITVGVIYAVIYLLHAIERKVVA